MAPPDHRFAELASVVAHELMAPLTVIGSAAALLDDLDASRDGEEVQRIAATITRNVELARLVVEGLRNADADGSDVHLVPRQTDLPQLVADAVADLDRTVLRDHPTEIEAPAHLVCELDPLRIRQVLFNLLSNAAKYSPAGRVITVSVTSQGDTVAVVVRDRGHGVAPDDSDRIFDKWTRVGTDDDVQGLGLGLHLSRAIARAHGGDLCLQPAAEEGAVFRLELPCRGPAD